MSDAANDNRDGVPDGSPLPAQRPCPICGRPPSPADKPFCSRRCADVDLHRWLGGVYAVPAAPTDDDDLTDAEPDRF